MSGSSWGGWGSPHGGHGRTPWGSSGPPPWVAGLFGLAQQGASRGPKVRRGDVRTAILDVLAAEPMNGYQVIQQIAERTGGAWKPSPGSVYPTLQQLEDEGLVESDESDGRRMLRLSAAGREYVAEHPDELAATWRAFDESAPEQSNELKPVIGQVMSAVWQVIMSGNKQQQAEAAEILAETRRQLYGLLADGDPRMNAQPELRIGDVDREAAASALGEHFAHGRLTREEYDERSAVAWASRTGSDLRPLFADLPGPHPAVLGPARRVTADRSSRLARPEGPGPGRGFRFPFLPLVLVVVGIALLTDGLAVLLLLLALGWVLVLRGRHRVGGHCRSHGAQRG